MDTTKIENFKEMNIMKKILAKGLTVGMIVAMMASSMSFADATVEGRGIPSDRLEQVKEKMGGKFEGAREGMKVKIEGFRELTAEEKITSLEEKLADTNLTDEMKERIQDQIDGIEERAEFQNMMDDLLDGKSDDEKVDALEDLLNGNDYDERRVKRIERMITRYTVGEDTMDAIKAALEGVEKEDRMDAVEDLINSGDYSDEAVSFLEEMQERMVKGEELRAKMEELRADFEGLTKEEREAKIQEMIDFGDYDDELLERLQKGPGKKGNGDERMKKDGGFKGQRGPQEQE